MLYKILAVSISLSYCLSASAETLRIEGKSENFEQNPLLQGPTHFSTFHVPVAENLLVDSIDIQVNLAASEIPTRGGLTRIPDWLANPEEFSITLIAPDLQRFPVSRPVQYSHALVNLTLPFFPISQVSANQAAPNLGTVPTLIADNSSGVEIPLRSRTNLVGPMMDEEGQPVVDAEGKVRHLVKNCEVVSEHDAGEAVSYPICSARDIQAFRALYPSSEQFTSKSNSITVKFPSARNIAGTWALVSTDTRPVVNDQLSLSMIPLAADPSGISLSARPIGAEALYPRMTISTSSLEFQGTLNPLPDRSSRTRRFNNELNQPIENVLGESAAELPTPDIPSSSISTGIELPTLTTHTDTIATQLRNRMAKRGANRTVASGLTAESIHLVINADKVDPGPEARPLRLTLLSPGGVRVLLSENFSGGESLFVLGPGGEALPPEIQAKPVDGVWKLLIQDRRRQDRHNDFELDWSMYVTGKLTERFYIQELEQPRVLRDGSSTGFFVDVTDVVNQPKEIWLRPFADNFIAFRHTINVVSPSGKRYEPCEQTQSTDARSCIEIGIDGLSRRVRLAENERANGRWLIHWRVERDLSLLEDQTGGAISADDCERDDLQQVSDPVLSSAQARMDNPFGISATDSQIRWAEFFTANSVEVNGLSLGISETELSEDTFNHAVLDRVEQMMATAEHSRSALTNSYWEFLRLLNDVNAQVSEERWQQFFVDISSSYVRGALESHMGMRGAMHASMFSSRFIDQDRRAAFLDVMSARDRGLSNWRTNLTADNAMAILEGWHTLRQQEYQISSVSSAIWSDDNIHHYMDGGQVKDSAKKFGRVWLDYALTVNTTTAAIFIGCAVTTKLIPGCAVGAITGGITQGGKMLPDVWMAGFDLAIDVAEAVVEENAEPTEPLPILFEVMIGDEYIVCDEQGNCAYHEIDDEGNAVLTGFAHKNETGVVQDPDTGNWLVCSEDRTDCDVYKKDQEGEWEKQPETRDGSGLFGGEDTNGDGGNSPEDPEQCDEDDETCTETDETVQDQCNPMIDGCGDYDLPTWITAMVQSGSVQDPFLLHWGELAPYIRCGPDGCMKTSVVLPRVNAWNDLSPYIDCDAEGIACGSENQIGKVCTTFNWSDTFTDPLPDQPLPDDDDPEPDCTDASNPCQDPGGGN